MTRFKFPEITRWTTFHQMFIASYWVCENRYTPEELAYGKDYAK